MVKKLLPVLLLSVVMAGCATTSITNLTPNRVYRNETGQYPVEAAFHSDQQSLRWDSITPEVIIEKDTFPMRHTPLMTNRWETLIPVPPGNNVVYYRFKFDYKYNAFGSAPQPQSTVSQIYRMQIIDK
ncbi:MAG TPA: hypothetical protein VFB72_01845 [Verrucomicrobiae bacterium]|nr:hypothetical protein [Verrucomicrobiae bacterium]